RASPRNTVLRRADRRPRRRRERPSGGGRRSARVRPDADDGPRRESASGGERARGRMRVAVVGGTGAFAKALAMRRKAAGYEVVVGSRDAERAAVVADELGVEGLTNDEAARSAELVILATNADGTLATAQQLREAIGETPVLCVASELNFRQLGVYPCT